MAKIHECRTVVNDYFEHQARLVNTNIFPAEDEKILDLLDRLYEEYGGSRGIIIELSYKETAVFDYFMKIDDVKGYEVELLYIVTSRPLEHLDKLWAMYILWMRRDSSVPEIERGFQKTLE